MRIIGGRYRGFTLQSFPGENIRPTPAKIREAIFNIVGYRIIEAEFLDIFAGTGAIGIEAISRGAKNSTFIEIDNRAITIIKNNLKKICLNNHVDILQLDYLKAISYLKRNQRLFDIVFLDPPYKKDYFSKVLQEIDSTPIVKENGFIIVQHPTRLEVKKEDFKNLFFIKEKRYGISKITIFGIKL